MAWISASQIGDDALIEAIEATALVISQASVRGDWSQEAGGQ
jgi:hypothetical protein